jgi:hypothetical protein
MIACFFVFFKSGYDVIGITLMTWKYKQQKIGCVDEIGVD